MHPALIFYSLPCKRSFRTVETGACPDCPKSALPVYVTRPRIVMARPKTVTIRALHNGKTRCQREPKPPKRSTNERERTNRMPIAISTAASPKLKARISPNPSLAR